MRCVLQRVTSATLLIDNKEYSSIEEGFVILLGIGDTDLHEDIQWLVNKIIRMRVFPDENKLMNRSIIDVRGEVLVVSQFTLFHSSS